MSASGSSNIPQASILELKAITAQHVDRLAKEGRASVRGQPRQRAGLERVSQLMTSRSMHPDKISVQARDKHDRPAPGLVKRLAADARHDGNRRYFQDESGPGEEQRREIMKAKARQYEAMRRGDYSLLSERDLAESVIDVG